MILSMTGFGNATIHHDVMDIIISIKSINSKTFDCNLKLPALIKQKETEVKSILQSKLLRGKIDVHIHLDFKKESQSSYINQSLFWSYFNELSRIVSTLEISQDQIISHVLRHPDIFQNISNEINEDDWKLIEAAIQQAAQNTHEFRKKEGATLLIDLINRIDNILSITKEIELQEPKRLEIKREKLFQKLQELQQPENLDNNRLEQEILFFSEKLDITEEIVRLKSHCGFFTEIIHNNEEEKGKKLNFISQEIGREINTIGSKANDFTIQKQVVICKEELERIKEQLNNIL